MKCTDARTLANRENAKKSTGPRTEAGKARSRANAFQHGLAGDGVAFPGEVAGAMQTFVDRQVAAEPVAPRDDREQMLVEKIARIAWIVDRAERAEEAQAIIRSADAEHVLRRERNAEVAELVGQIEEDPTFAMQELLESKDGCRWAIDSIRELIDAVDADWWRPNFDNRVDALCAPPQPGRLGMSRAKALALALGGSNYDAIWPNGVPGLGTLEPSADADAARAWTELRDEIARESRPQWRADLKAILARRLAEIERRLEALEARPDAAMQYAAVAATFDPSEHPERLRRYIRSRERERRHLLAELADHRRSRDEHPNESEPVVEVAPAPAPEPPPTAADRQPETQAKANPDLPKNWVRSDAPAFDARGRRKRRPAMPVKASR